MRSAPGDKPSHTGDVALERSAAQTQCWFLGHRVTLAVIAAALATGVITASAIAAGSAPAAVIEQSHPSEAATTVVPTEATLNLSCGIDTHLTVTASGVGLLELTISGPSSGQALGPGTASATVTGPPGTYTVRASATGRLDRVSWYSTAGQCSE